MSASRPTPTGFLVLGFVLALLALVCAMALTEPGHGAVSRLLLGLIAALSVLAFEALWFGRPWVGRAIDAWAAACTSVVLVAAVAAVQAAFTAREVLTVAFGVFVVVGMPCLLVRWYVRERAASLGLVPSAPGAPAGLGAPTRP